MRSSWLPTTWTSSPYCECPACAVRSDATLTCFVNFRDVGCKTVANMIKGKTPEEIRKLFNIVNDFTPEEEAQIKKENVRRISLLIIALFSFAHALPLLGMGRGPLDD